MSDQFRYFEDYQVGQQGFTGTRTVTEADVVHEGSRTVMVASREGLRKQGLA